MSRKIGWLVALLWLGTLATQASAQDEDLLDINGPDPAPPVKSDIALHNRRLKGKLVDHTRNHGVDRRIWSRSLYQWRDVYIYLPPGYSKQCRYPVMYYLHGFGQDEESFLNIAPFIDDAISKKKLPPMIVVSPDGSLNGHCSINKPGSFWINSDSGLYEDFILQDVWDFVCHNYPIRPEREAHVLAGVSMGGFGAFNLGMRHRDAFGVAIGIFPPLNVRWTNQQGDPHADFDPRNWGWRQDFDRPHEIVGRIGAFKLRVSDLINPAFGNGDEAIINVSANNPIELIDRTRLRNGELEMMVAYGAKDQFNIDAQCESFLYLAKYRCLGVHVLYNPHGKHNRRTAYGFFPGIFDWLSPRLAPFAPGSLSSSAGVPIENEPVFESLGPNRPGELP